MNAPLYRFLMEFTPGKTDEVMTTLDDLDTGLSIEIAPMMTLTEADYARHLDEARQAAALEESARVEAILMARFETERAEAQAAFEDERRRWATEHGLILAESLTRAIATLEDALSTCLTQALRPLFVDALRDRILTELGTALSAILGDPSHPTFRLEGPEDLLSAFGDSYGGGVAIDYVVLDQTEIAVVTDSTRIVSRLSACLAAFQSTEG